MLERRRHPMHQPNHEITGKVKSTMDFRVVDISEGGLQVETRLGLPPASRCELKVSSFGSDCTFKAEVRRCRAQLTKTDAGCKVAYRSGLEFVDMTEITRRIEEGIYDSEEYEKALAWVKKNCAEGPDLNKKPSDRQRKDFEWEIVVKMTLICRDLMIGNRKLALRGWGEEARGRNAIAGGFQGQRQWTDHFPNADFTEAILNSSFDWNGIREAFVFATENDSLNGISMLFGHLLTNTAQIFSDVRTYWSPESVRRVTGKDVEGLASGGFIHLINSGSTTLDATAMQSDSSGNPVMKPFWEITEDEVKLLN